MYFSKSINMTQGTKDTRLSRMELWAGEVQLLLNLRFNFWFTNTQLSHSPLLLVLLSLQAAHPDELPATKPKSPPPKHTYSWNT